MGPGAGGFRLRVCAGPEDPGDRSGAGADVPGGKLAALVQDGGGTLFGEGPFELGGAHDPGACAGEVEPRAGSGGGLHEGDREGAGRAAGIVPGTGAGAGKRGQGARGRGNQRIGRRNAKHGAAGDVAALRDGSGDGERALRRGAQANRQRDGESAAERDVAGAARKYFASGGQAGGSEESVSGGVGRDEDVATGAAECAGDGGVGETVANEY